MIILFLRDVCAYANITNMGDVYMHDAPNMSDVFWQTSPSSHFRMHHEIWAGKTSLSIDIIRIFDLILILEIPSRCEKLRFLWNWSGAVFGFWRHRRRYSQAKNNLAPSKAVKSLKKNVCRCRRRENYSRNKAWRRRGSTTNVEKSLTPPKTASKNIEDIFFRVGFSLINK